jgi:hypothetical protein
MYRMISPVPFVTLTIRKNSRTNFVVNTTASLYCATKIKTIRKIMSHGVVFGSVLALSRIVDLGHSHSKPKRKDRGVRFEIRNSSFPLIRRVATWGTPALAFNHNNHNGPQVRAPLPFRRQVCPLISYFYYSNHPTHSLGSSFPKCIGSTSPRSRIRHPVHKSLTNHLWHQGTPPASVHVQEAVRPPLQTTMQLITTSRSTTTCFICPSFRTGAH